MLLLHLPDGRGTELVRDALVETVQTLPAHLKRSLGRHRKFTLAIDIPV